MRAQQTFKNPTIWEIVRLVTRPTVAFSQNVSLRNDRCLARPCNFFCWVVVAAMDFLSSSNVGNEAFDASFLQDFLQPAEDAFSEVQQCNLQFAPFQQGQCQQQQQQQVLQLPDFPLTLANSVSPSLKPAYPSINSASKGKRGARKRKTEVCDPPCGEPCSLKKASKESVCHKRSIKQ